MIDANDIYTPTPRPKRRTSWAELSDSTFGHRKVTPEKAATNAPTPRPGKTTASMSVTRQGRHQATLDAMRGDTAPLTDAQLLKSAELAAREWADRTARDQAAKGYTATRRPTPRFRSQRRTNGQHD